MLPGYHPCYLVITPLQAHTPAEALRMLGLDLYERVEAGPRTLALTPALTLTQALTP